MIDTLMIVAAVFAIFGATAECIQLILQWNTLREVGDLDGDRDDWWEKMPFRKKKKK